MPATLYRVVDPDNRVIIDGVPLLEAVEAAYRQGGFGFKMERNLFGAMVAFCSSRPVLGETFTCDGEYGLECYALYPESDLDDDEQARQELARKIYEEYGRHGDAHHEYPLLIQEIP